MAVRAGPDVRVLVDGARVQSPGLMGPAAWRQRYAPVPASGDVLGFEVPADAPAIRLALRRVATAAAGHARVTVHGGERLANDDRPDDGGGDRRGPTRSPCRSTTRRRSARAPR
jgi:hypothetical protein